VHLLAQADFQAPFLDYHAIAPELVLTGALLVLLVVDLIAPAESRWASSTVAAFGLLASLLPILTLAVDGGDRSLFGGAYVVDDFALVLKGLFLAAGYVTVLISTNEIGEGDYQQGEYYFLLLSSILGMTVMASARDLVSIFVALELLSIPAYLLAGWRKRDLRGNEAGLKYYLMGVFASAIMLYGMSLVYGVSGTTVLTGISEAVGATADSRPVVTLGILFVLIGFLFKVSAVPFHTWAPDTYEGAPTPITAFLSVASKAAGFVALLELVLVGFLGRDDVYRPLFWILCAVTMTVGNLIALRQTNIVRLLAYSSVAQGGFILLPFVAVRASDTSTDNAMTAIITYLVIYAAMNLGAFAVVIAVARKTRSGTVASYGGLFEYAPGLAVLMAMFLFSLAGIPPLGGWMAKFVVFRALLTDADGWSVALAVVAAVNSVIGLFYYASVAREMFFRPVPDEDRTRVRVPLALAAAVAITAVATLVFGVLPGIATRLGDLGDLVAAGG
jgi:NADH-quinone oxidoreductase subunit N